MPLMCDGFSVSWTSSDAPRINNSPRCAWVGVLESTCCCRCYHFGDTSSSLQVVVVSGVLLLCDSLATGKWNEDIRVYSSRSDAIAGRIKS